MDHTLAIGWLPAQEAPGASIPTEDGTLLRTHDVPPEQDPLAVYLRRLAPGSRRTMRGALDRIAYTLSGGRCDARTLAWTRIRYQHGAAACTVLAAQHAPATVNKMRAALRGVLRECWRLGYITAEEHERAADLPTVRGRSLPRGRALSIGELTTLFAGCATDGRPAGTRDAALLAVLYGAGLRRSELVALDLADWSSRETALRVRNGKARKARMCYTPEGCTRALENWIALRGDAPGPLFCPIDKSGRITIRRLVDQSVLDVLTMRAKRHGVAPFSPHDLRRTFISDLLERGADIATVGALAGHASVQTTTRYDRRGESTKRRAVGLLHVPYLSSSPSCETRNGART